MAFRAMVCALLIGGVLWASASHTHAGADGEIQGSETAIFLDRARSQALALASSARGAVEVAYARAPALVAVLAALLVVPVAALIALVGESLRRRLAAVRDRARSTTDRVSTVPAHVTPWPARAWLRLDGETGPVQPIAGPLIRIGRHEENDILLAAPSVHRHHAIIHHTTDQGFTITDLTGANGNGVLINGERLRQALLYNGDRIELGEARMTFESAPL